MKQAEETGGESKAPSDYLQRALDNQRLDEASSNYKETWIEGDYKYTVRIHQGNSTYTNADTIYRVSRQSTLRDAFGQGSGTEYLGSDGNWYYESVLKEFLSNGDPNPLFSEEAARLTHIPLGG